MKKFTTKIKMVLSKIWEYLRKTFFNLKELESIMQTFLTNLIVDESIAHAMNVIINGDFSRMTLLAFVTAIGRTFLKAIWQVVKVQILTLKNTKN